MAKAFAIIYMVVDHVYERMSVVDSVATLPDGALRNIIEFAGGPLAAPVFMFSMGIGMMYTRHNSPGDFMKRGLRLLIAAYILNLVRFTGPLLALKAMGVDADYGYSVLDTFFLADGASEESPYEAFLDHVPGTFDAVVRLSCRGHAVCRNIKERAGQGSFLQKNPCALCGSDHISGILFTAYRL